MDKNGSLDLFVDKFIGSKVYVVIIGIIGKFVLGFYNFRGFYNYDNFLIYIMYF